MSVAPGSCFFLRGRFAGTNGIVVIENPFRRGLVRVRRHIDDQAVPGGMFPNIGLGWVGFTDLGVLA